MVSSGCRGLSLFPTRAQRALIDRNLALMGMENMKTRSFAARSGGQQQRTLLARALCATQTMLLLDEPVAGLDPIVTREMYQTIEMLHREKGLTVVMISHDLEAALSQGDRILHISHEGIFLGTPEEYRHSPLGQRFTGGCSHD